MLCLLQTSDIQKRERLSRGASWLKYSFCLTPAHPECSVFSADDSLSGNLLFQAKAQVLLGSQGLLCVPRIPPPHRVSGRGRQQAGAPEGELPAFYLSCLPACPRCVPVMNVTVQQVQWSGPLLEVVQF